MSTTLITYLDYMSTWDTESDENINKLIDEHNLFLTLGDFKSDSAIDSEFATLVGMATTVRDETIAADAVQIAADAAAVAAIWSFGLSMAAFASLEVSEAIWRSQISSKSTELNNKLKTVDTDIAALIDNNVNRYVVSYKANNTMVTAKMPSGLDNRTCRSLLLQFIAEIQKSSDKLDANSFRKHAESARKLYNSNEINQVYDALDTLNLSGKSDADIQKFLGFIKGLQIPGSMEMALVRNLSIAIMARKLGNANETIKKNAKAAGLEVAEVESSAFGMLDAVGKFFTAAAVVMSVIDIVLQVIDIVDVVKQSGEMVDQLNGPIKDHYKTYFNGIRDAAKAYNAAIAQKPSS